MSVFTPLSGECKIDTVKTTCRQIMERDNFSEIRDMRKNTCDSNVTVCI